MKILSATDSSSLRELILTRGEVYSAKYESFQPKKDGGGREKKETLHILLISIKHE